MKIAALLLLCLAAGCASTPTPDASVGAPITIHMPTLLTPSPGTGIVFIKRDAGFFGGGCNHAILLDGKLLAELRPGEAVTFYPAAGEHILGLNGGIGLCPNSTPELAIQVRAGERKAYRTLVEQSGDTAIRPTAF